MPDGEYTGALDGGTAIARAVLYRFLSRCFSHPDQEFLELLDGGRLEEVLRSWRHLGLGTSEIVSRAVGWLAECPSREAALLELEKEYTRLFITAHPKVVAPPYSSVYLDAEGLVWGAGTAQAAKLYEAAGLGIAQGFHDIPDHIAAELEFVSYLIVERQKGESNNTGPAQDLASIEKKFLEEHLFRWIPSFLSRVIEHSRVAFYRDIALLAREFLERDSVGYSQTSLQAL